jgi:hypothetical protein
MNFRFDRKVLETLREPLEAGRITISRAARQAHFARRASGGFSGSVSIGRSDESLPVRLARRSERPLSMHARHSHALSAQIVGAAA